MVRALSWPGIELRHLAALRAVARERSFGRAAMRLGYTQSAISQQIAALERALGQRLLERPSGRGAVDLTAAGRIVVEYADEVARQLAAAKARLEALERAEPVIRVGVHASTGLAALPEILVQMGGSSLGRVETCEHPDDRHLVDLVLHEELDAAFVNLPVAADVAVAELLREDCVAAMAPQVAARLDEPVDASRLAGQQLLVLRSCNDEIARAGLTPAFESDDPGLLCRMAAGRHGVAVLPRSLAPLDDQRLQLRELRPAPLRRLGLAWSEDARARSPLLARFVETTVACFAPATQRLAG
ncbi:MAG: LysR family transcriptional regulator [Actinobacteria bacterium]|nr:LysR family transcriptional regulator [Actinomycetota bacterium]